MIYRELLSYIYSVIYANYLCSQWSSKQRIRLNLPISAFYPHFSVLPPISAFYPHFSVLSPFQRFIPISAFYPHFSVLSPFQRFILIPAFYPHFSVLSSFQRFIPISVSAFSFRFRDSVSAFYPYPDRDTFNKMQDITLNRTNTKAFAYNTTSPVEFLGKFEGVIETRKRISIATFYVAKGKNCGNLLSFSTAQDLGLVSLNIDKLTSKDAALENILQKNSKVFSGLGKLKGEKIKLDIDKTQTPKAQPQRRVPYHIREKVKNAITELEKQDIIEKVPENEATPWVSPIVAVPKKDGQVRICVDMRLANEAIRRVRHQIPTVNDISFALNGAKFFSKLDLSQAYHRLELHEQSRYVTTFELRYKRCRGDISVHTRNCTSRT